MSTEDMDIDVANPSVNAVGISIAGSAEHHRSQTTNLHNDTPVIDRPITNDIEAVAVDIAGTQPVIGEGNMEEEQETESVSDGMNDVTVPDDIKIDLTSISEPFYLRYYSGYKGRFGHEFLEFDVKVMGDGRSAALRYANNSNYRNDDLIRKEVAVGALIVRQLKSIIAESEILKEDDAKWPEKNKDGKQELEIRAGKYHISFETSKLGSLNDVQNSDDPEGLRVFYYLVQDLKALVFSLISLHFKIKPI